MHNLQRQEHRACFGGWQDVYQHRSQVLDCDMTFAVYLPPQAAHTPCPVLYWLSGLTCNEQNFITKAGAQAHAAEHGVIMVVPDTSPRGDAVADADSYDLGQGAGFYLNATQPPWAPHYRMYDYIVEELPALVEANFATTGARAISGHSMGGHGALMIALRNPGRYRSVSAFSPIVAPSQVPWGEKAFSAYLGSDRAAWKTYDTVELLRSADLRRSRRRRRVPRRPAQTPPAATGRRRGQAPADPAPATRLRPQLLLHFQLHRRTPRPSCTGTGIARQVCGLTAAASRHLGMSA